MSKVILVLCLVMANIKESSFIYIEYDTMQECMDAWKRIEASEPPPEVKAAYGVCTQKIKLNEEFLKGGEAPTTSAF